MFGKTSSYFFLTLSVLVTFSIGFLSPTPTFDYDFEQFFAQDDPDLTFYQDVYVRDFGSDNDYLLLAVNNPKGDLLDSAFLSKAFLLKSSIQSLEGVDTVISVFDLQIPIINAFGLQSFPVLDWSSNKSLNSSREKLSQFKGSLIAKDESSFLFLVKNSNQLSKEQGDELYEQIKQIFSNHGLKPHAVAGKIQTQHDFVELMEQEFILFLGASLGLMLLVLYLVFRKLWGIMIPVVVLVLGISWVFGLIFLAGQPLDIMSVMQPTLFLIVGLSALIHYFSPLVKKLQLGRPKELAIQETFRELTFPVGLTIITTSIGFFSLYFTSIPALKTFGLWTGIGILLLFIAILFVTPGLLHLFSLSEKKTNYPGNFDRFLTSLFQKIIQKRRTIAIFFFFTSLIGIGLSFQLRINGFLLDNLPLDHPIQKDFAYFDQFYGGSNPLEIHLEKGPMAENLFDLKVLEEIQKMEVKLHELFGERAFLSPLSVVKTLNQAQNQGNSKSFILPTRGQYLRMNRFIEPAFRQEGLNILSSDYRSGRISGRLSDLGSLRMGELRAEFLDFVRKEIDPQLLKVRWTGTAHLIDRGHESVTLQMAKGLGLAFLIVGLIAGVLFRSLRIAFLLLIPNIIPLIWLCGLMSLLGIDFKLTTSILFTVAFGIAVDDTIHFMSKLKFELAKGKSLYYAIKRTFIDAGRSICLTSVILVSGFGLLILSQFGVTHYTGLLVSISLVFALLADLVLLPVLLFSLKKSILPKIKV